MPRSHAAEKPYEASLELSDLKSDFTLTLDYLNPALKNPPLTYTHLFSSTDF